MRVHPQQIKRFDNLARVIVLLEVVDAKWLFIDTEYTQLLNLCLATHARKVSVLRPGA
jgi:hypothetical protein